jgi:serine O-acetyltransferase
MINSWEDCRAYLAADRARYERPLFPLLLQMPQYRWQVRLRLTEWWCNTIGGPVGLLLRWRLQVKGHKLGYSIAVNRIGPGLRLPHVGVIVINGEAVVGNNCQLLQGVTLAGNEAGAPTIGNEVFVGPNVTVVGDIEVGDGAQLVAGAVVTRSVPAGEIWGGVPARSLPGDARRFGDRDK